MTRPGGAVVLVGSRASSRSRADHDGVLPLTAPVVTSTEKASRSPYQPPVEYTDAYAVLSPARMLTFDTATADAAPDLFKRSATIAWIFATVPVTSVVVYICPRPLIVACHRSSTEVGLRFWVGLGQVGG